jgi:lysophospholipase L1-like esterase
VSFPDTLFIGDSRSVGLRDYGKISDATFFCNVGLRSSDVLVKSAEVAGYGTIKLQELLKKKQFKQIYFMLGINELGNNLNHTAGDYQKFVTGALAIQPNTKIILCSTLHVTKKCNDITEGSKRIFTNERINNFNALVEAMADNQKVFYLNVNRAFDDEAGHLSTAYAAGDGIHITVKGYMVWRDFIDKNRF